MYRTKKSKEMSNITNLSQILCSIKNNKLGTVDGTQINEAEGGTLIMGLGSDDYLWDCRWEKEKKSLWVTLRTSKIIIIKMLFLGWIFWILWNMKRFTSVSIWNQQTLDSPRSPSFIFFNLHQQPVGAHPRLRYYVKKILRTPPKGLRLKRMQNYPSHDRWTQSKRR